MIWSVFTQTKIISEPLGILAVTVCVCCNLFAELFPSKAPAFVVDGEVNVASKTSVNTYLSIVLIGSELIK